MIKILFVNFVAICAKKVSGTKGSICKLLNGLEKMPRNKLVVRNQPKKQSIRKQP